MKAIQKVSGSLVFLILLAGLILALPQISKAETEGDFTYTVIDDETAAITGYTGTETNVVIPATVAGLEVVRIEAEAFLGSSIKSVVVPEGVISINDKAFKNSSSLTAILLPDSLTTISVEAFSGCSSLKEITIPKNVILIDSTAFSGCIGLTKMVVAEDNAIYDSHDNCNAIIETQNNMLIAGCKNTIIPASVTWIGPSAFASHTELTSFTVPYGVTYIDNNAFSRCSNLKYVSFPTSVTYIGLGAFQYCGKLNGISLPERLKSIEQAAFAFCTGLEEITLPSSLTTIKQNAFNGCSGLKTIHYTGSEMNWSNLSVGTGNTVLSDAGVMFYQILSYDSVELVKYIGMQTDIIVPSDIDHYRVTSIGNGAFYGCTQIRTITLTESVERIGDQAFYDCRNLNSIHMEDSIQRIGSSAFAECRSLQSFTAPTSLIYIGDYCFSGCSKLASVYLTAPYLNEVRPGLFSNCGNLTEVILPEGANKVGEYVFYNCSKLESVYLPTGIRSIEQYLFYGCTSLTEVNLSLDITSIKGYAFYGCAGLELIDIPEYVTTIDVYAFGECKGLKSITIPDSVTTIGEGAFSGCSSIVTATLPSKITSLPGYLFNSCSNLKNIEIPATVASIGSSAFANCSSLESIALPNKLREIASNLFYGCESLTDVSIPAGVLSIQDYAFANCSRLTTFEIPVLVTEISNGVFSGCTGLLSVDIPDDVTSIGYSAFYNCNSLKNPDIPEGITSIGSSAFAECSSLTSFTIPKWVKAINDSVFSGCERLTSVTIPDGVTSIGTYAFNRCTRLGTINVPESVTKIGAGAFSECDRLKSFTFPANVVSIEDSIFSGCDRLEEVVLPQGTTTIGTWSFSGCNNLKSLEIPATVVSIGSYAFNSCYNLKELIFPEGITTLSDGVLSGCSGLTSFTIPESVTVIGNSALSSCGGLREITIPAAVTTIKENAFSSCSGLSSVILSEGLATIEKYAFAWTYEMREILIPESVTFIGEYAFDGKYGDFTIIGYSGSEAEWFAEDNNYRFIDINSCIFPTSITLSQTKAELPMYESLSLYATVLPNNATVKTVLWKSSDSSIAVVDSYGNVTAKEPGTAFITAESRLGGVSASCTITVPQDVRQASVSVTLDKTNFDYTGQAIEPVFVIKDDQTVLQKGTDYEVAYYNNINAGSAEIRITGKGSYHGTRSEYFTIDPIALPVPQLVSSNVVYNGDFSIPEVTFGTGYEDLKLWQDYDVQCGNNVNVGNAVATVSGKGNYVGTYTLQYTISPYDLKNAKLEYTTVTYNGYPFTPAVTTEDGAWLKTGQDIDVVYRGNVNAGTATATITGLGNCTGTVTREFTIDPMSLPMVTYDMQNKTYTGQEIKPDVWVGDMYGPPLKEGEDYEVTYNNNINAGSAEIIVTGIGNYTGTYTSWFTIEPISLETATVVSSDTEYNNPMGMGAEPNLTVTLNGKDLQKGVDYYVSCMNNYSIGTAEYWVYGMGNYSGTISGQFTIVPGIIPDSQLEFTTTSFRGTAIEPMVYFENQAMMRGYDYEVSYADNRDAGTATVTVTGMNNYKGSYTKTFTITPCELQNVYIDSSYYIYDGSAHEPVVTVEKDAFFFEKGRDYDVVYSNNVNAGTASVTITGMGNCTGTVTKEFEISQAPLPMLHLSEQNFEYTGEAIEPTVLFDGMNPLMENVDYEISYYNNVNIGSADVTVTGIGNYFGMYNDHFSINPISIEAASIEGTVAGCMSASLEIDETVKINVHGVEKTLVRDTDYSITAMPDPSMMTAEVYVYGMGYYSGYASASLPLTNNHEPGEMRIENQKEPGCDYAGSYDEVYYCKNCGNEISRVTKIVEPRHMLCEIGAHEATCTSEGNKVYWECTMCGKVFADSEGKNEYFSRNDYIIEKFGHDYQEVAGSAVAATCSNAGKEADKECTRCHDKIAGQVIAPLEHSYKETLFKATMSADGWITDACEICQAERQTTVIPRIKTVSLNKASFNYNGKVQKPDVIVKDRNNNIIESRYYSLIFSKGCKTGGSYTVTVKFRGLYEGEKVLTFKINKIANPLTLKVSTKSYSSSKDLKKAKSFSIGASKAQGTLTYTPDAKAKKAGITVTAKGKVIIPKNCKKGTYKIKVKAAGNANYKEGSKTVTIKVSK